MPERCIYWRCKEARWRVLIIRQGRRYEKHFSSAAYGSRKKAEKAAITWRNQVCKMVHRVVLKTRDARNRSGFIGISLTFKTNPSGQKYWSWNAQWRKRGRTYTRKFAVLKFGDGEARELAIQARKRGTSVISDT